MPRRTTKAVLRNVLLTVKLRAMFENSLRNASVREFILRVRHPYRYASRRFGVRGKVELLGRARIKFFCTISNTRFAILMFVDFLFFSFNSFSFPSIFFFFVFPFLVFFFLFPCGLLRMCPVFSCFLPPPFGWCTAAELDDALS